MKGLKILFSSLLIAGLLVVGYGVINWITFLNIIEQPLDESEEKIPDLGIVDNMTIPER